MYKLTARVASFNELYAKDTDLVSYKLVNDQQAAIKQLTEAVLAAQEFGEWFIQHSRQAAHAHSELGQKLEETAGWKEMEAAGYDGYMAACRDQFAEALAKL